MKYFFSFILLFLIVNSFAQLQEVAEKSYVLPENQTDEIEVKHISDNEIIYINYQSFRSKKLNNYVINKLDSNLIEKWSVDIPVEPKFTKRDIYFNADFLFLLLSEEYSKKSLLISVSLQNGQSTQNEFETLTLFSLNSFSVFENNIFIQGEYRGKSMIEMYNFKDKTAKVLPELYNKNTIVMYHWINENRREIYVFVEEPKKCNLSLLVYDESGKYLYRKELNHKKKRFLEYNLSLQSDGDVFIKGTFGQSCSDLSEGFFMGSLDYISEIKYFPYSSLSSFSENLNDKKRLALNKKNQKNQFTRFKTIYNDLLKKDEVLVAEVYQQETEPVTYFNNYRPISKRKFFVIEMDKNQNLTHNFSIDLNNIGFHAIKPSIGMLMSKNNYNLFYIINNDLYLLNDLKNKPTKYAIFPKEINTINSPVLEILSSTAQTFYIHGTASVNYGGEQNFTVKEHYFIKKFSVK